LQEQHISQLKYKENYGFSQEEHMSLTSVVLEKKYMVHALVYKIGGGHGACALQLAES
jgi:hypothetical protein